MADKANQKCKVCDGDVTGAHKCMKCQESVHFICGKGVGEEGYGQGVVCKICEKRNSITATDVQSTEINSNDSNLKAIQNLFNLLNSLILFFLIDKKDQYIS